MMLKKMPDRSIHTKTIQRGETGVKVTWIRRDPDGREIGREYPTDDTYDPRTRPWYSGAVSTPGVFWTGVYIFFTDQKPGITAAKAFRNGKGELLGVIGLDIELTSLSAFLGSLQIGRSGRAMIIDETGRLVAYPEVARMMKEKGGELVALRLNELGDPVLDRAFNRFLIEKDGRRELSVQGITYINTFSSLQSAVDKRWSILIVVPSQDFVGFVSSNNRKALLMSIGVVILASLLAGLLIWQGLQADRSARLLLERRQEMETQSRAFSDLAARPAIFDPADIEALEHVTRITAEAIGVRRVSVWQWQLDGNVFFFGRDWQTAPADTLDAMRGRIGRVFSSGSWLEGFSLIENILMPQLHHTRRPIPELRQEAAQLAEQFSLPGLPLGQPEKYSRADLQRSACVRAFLGTPSLLLLEDPTFGVYPRIMTALVSAIRRARNRGAAVLWMTLSDDVWGDNSIPADRFFSVSGRKLTEVKRQT
jgi:ABC-type ATPase involved in cell division